MGPKMRIKLLRILIWENLGLNNVNEQNQAYYQAFQALNIDFARRAKNPNYSHIWFKKNPNQDVCNPCIRVLIKYVHVPGVSALWNLVDSSLKLGIGSLLPVIFKRKWKTTMTTHILPALIISNFHRNLRLSENFHSAGTWDLLKALPFH